MSSRSSKQQDRQAGLDLEWWVEGMLPSGVLKNVHLSWVITETQKKNLLKTCRTQGLCQQDTQKIINCRLDKLIKHKYYMSKQFDFLFSNNIDSQTATKSLMNKAKLIKQYRNDEKIFKGPEAAYFEVKLKINFKNFPLAQLTSQLFLLKKNLRDEQDDQQTMINIVLIANSNQIELKKESEKFDWAKVFDAFKKITSYFTFRLVFVSFRSLANFQEQFNIEYQKRQQLSQKVDKLQENMVQMQKRIQKKIDEQMQMIMNRMNEQNLELNRQFNMINDQFRQIQDVIKRFDKKLALTFIMNDRSAQKKEQK